MKNKIVLRNTRGGCDVMLNKQQFLALLAAPVKVPPKAFIWRRIDGLFKRYPRARKELEKQYRKGEGSYSSSSDIYKFLFAVYRKMPPRSRAWIERRIAKMEADKKAKGKLPVHGHVSLAFSMSGSEKTLIFVLLVILATAGGLGMVLSMFGAWCAIAFLITMLVSTLYVLFKDNSQVLAASGQSVVTAFFRRVAMLCNRGTQARGRKILISRLGIKTKPAS